MRRMGSIVPDDQRSITIDIDGIWTVTVGRDLDYGRSMNKHSSLISYHQKYKGNHTHHKGF